MFENINIDTNYILIALIILTLVCIYLLYNSFTNNNNVELEQRLNNLVLQQKKREEIIHFLVNQVQLFQSQMPFNDADKTNQLDNTDERNNTDEQNDTVEHNYMDKQSNTYEQNNTDKQNNIDEQYNEQNDKNLQNNIYKQKEKINNNVKNTHLDTDEIKKLDEILNEKINNTDNFTTNKKTTDSPVYNETTDGTHINNIPNFTNLTTNDVSNKSNTSLDNESNKNTQNDELVNNVLSDDKNDIPKDKTLLGLNTVTDLRNISKKLNISTSGSKSILINRIFDTL